MEIFKEQSNTYNIIKKVSSNSITINELDYTHSLIVSPDTIIPDWRPTLLAEVQKEDLNMILEKHPDLLLLGTGDKHEFPLPALLESFYHHRIGVEVMTTQAACRTFNILAREGRHVIAALLLRNK